MDSREAGEFGRVARPPESPNPTPGAEDRVLEMPPPFPLPLPLLAGSEIRRMHPFRVGRGARTEVVCARSSRSLAQPGGRAQKAGSGLIRAAQAAWKWMGRT